MAASSRGSVLGSGKANTTRGIKKISVNSTPQCHSLLRSLFQMHVAELLVSHGANLNAKTFLEETPMGMLKIQIIFAWTSL